MCPHSRTQLTGQPPFWTLLDTILEGRALGGLLSCISYSHALARSQTRGFHHLSSQLIGQSKLHGSTVTVSLTRRYISAIMTRWQRTKTFGKQQLMTDLPFWSTRDLHHCRSHRQSVLISPAVSPAWKRPARQHQAWNIRISRWYTYFPRSGLDVLPLDLEICEWKYYLPPAPHPVYFGKTEAWSTQ